MTIMMMKIILIMTTIMIIIMIMIMITEMLKMFILYDIQIQPNLGDHAQYPAPWAFFNHMKGDLMIITSSNHKFWSCQKALEMRKLSSDLISSDPNLCHPNSSDIIQSHLIINDLIFSHQSSDLI